MATLRDVLDQSGVTQQVRLPADVDAFLNSFTVTAPGVATVTPNLSLLGFASFKFDTGQSVSFSLQTAADNFQVDIDPPPLALPPGLQPANFVADSGGGHLQPVGGGPAHVRLADAVAVRVAGDAVNPATLRFVHAGQEGIVADLELVDGDSILFGATGLGLRLPDGLILDDSATETPPAPAARHDTPFPSETPAWRGIAVRGATLFLPPQIPLIGGLPIAVDLEVGSPRGMDARIQVSIPAQGSRPAVDATLEWHDPAALSLADAVPTLIDVSVELQADGSSVVEPSSSQPVTLGGGRPLRLRGRLSRDPQSGDIGFDLSAEGVGAEGLVSVTAGPADTAAKVFVTATALATAVIADSQQPPDQHFSDASGTTLHLLLLAAAALSSFTDGGRVVVYGAEVAGDVRTLGDRVRMRLDYSVDVVVTTFSVGVVSVGMNPDVPMRIRYRDVLLEVDLPLAGLDSFHLSFAGARVDVEDPGGWLVQSPGSLLDVVGTRSGHGSSWFEIDLRFALDLGPVKISGATIRATFGNGSPAVELRGLDASLAIPGLIAGEGVARVTDAGLDIGLAARIIPLGVAAMAFVSYEEEAGVRKVLLDVALDLPAPVPLASTGLGLFGINGVFAVNGTLPEPPPGADPVDFQLQWRPTNPHAVPVRAGGLVLGLGAVVGTVPDLGFAFNTMAMVVVSAPDVTVRAALDAHFLAERSSFTDITAPPGPAPGLRVLGLLVAGPTAVDLALRGTFEIPVLLRVEVPVSAHYPYGSNAWFLHVGADGVQGRGPGPVSIRVLPGFLDFGGSGFLMLHGDGLPDLGGRGVDLDGFAVGFGFAIDIPVGAVGVLWAEMQASLVAGIGTHPPLFVAHGELGASLHLGPFTLGGIRASIDAQVGPDSGHHWLAARICGEVDLWFTTLSGCIDLSVGELSQDIPEPPADVLAKVSLTDYFGLELAGGDGLTAGDRAGAPTVWPDAVPVLEFSTGPACALTGGPFLDDLTRPGPGGGRMWADPYGGDGRYGTTELRYTFSLTTLDLAKVDRVTGAETPLPAGTKARWQLPRHGDPTAGPLTGARELALLTWERHGWTRCLLDGGSGIPGDPLASLPRLCRQRVAAAAGWALGADAIRERLGEPWVLPPEQQPPVLAGSTFAALVTVRLGETQLIEQFLPALDLPVAWSFDGPGPLGAAIALADRTFDGQLTLPYMIGDPRLLTEVTDQPAAALVSLTDPLTEPLLCLAGRPDLLDRVTVDAFADPPSGAETWFAIDSVTGPEGLEARTYAPPRPAAWASLRVTYPPVAPLGVLGVQGLTASAVAGADQGNAAAAAAAGSQGATAATPPGQRRDLLEPGALYRLGVGVTATGARPGASPKSFPEQRRDYWFQVAPKPAAPGPGPGLSPRSAVLRTWDSFDPSYLERYLLGYTPEDKTECWFTADPVAAHFAVDHVAALAARYDRDLTLRVTRTDTVPASPDPGQAFTASSLVELIEVGRAALADQRLAALAAQPSPGLAPCPVPRAGATLPAAPVLAPHARYDLEVAFPPAGQASGGHVLPGVVFTTSRYACPPALLAALGFPATGPAGTISGDQPVTFTSLPGGAGGDAAMASALLALGLDPWPLPPEARTSALWVRAGTGWLLHGLLLEAPEPLFRLGAPPSVAEPAPPPRFALTAVSCGGGTFDQRCQDTSATRVLWLAATPFTPAGPLLLTATGRAPLVSPATPPSTLTGSSSIGATPAFAGDLS